jgi:hypothetical protein
MHFSTPVAGDDRDGAASGVFFFTEKTPRKSPEITEAPPHKPKNALEKSRLCYIHKSRGEEKQKALSNPTKQKNSRTQAPESEAEMALFHSIPARPPLAIVTYLRIRWAPLPPPGQAPVARRSSPASAEAAPAAAAAVA